MVAGSSMAIFTGLSSGTAERLSFVKIGKSSSLILREHEIAIDDHPDREAGPDREGRLDIDLAAHELLSGLIDRILASTLQSPDEVALIAVRAKLRADAEQGRERRRLQKIFPSDNRRHPRVRHSLPCR